MKDIYDFAYPSRKTVLATPRRHRSTLAASEKVRDTVVAMKKYKHGGLFPAEAFAPDRIVWDRQSSTQDR